MRKSKILLPPFNTGQVWQMGDSQVEIGVVGKRLVHYRHFKPSTKRPAVQLSGKAVLEKFLQTHDAILLEPAPPAPAATRNTTLPGRARRKSSPAVESPAATRTNRRAPVVIQERSSKI